MAWPENQTHIHDGRIELVEETAEFYKVQKVTGLVTVTSVTDETNEVIHDILEHRLVNVERVPIGRFVETAPLIREEDGVTIMPVFEERLVVEKRLFLVEELHIRHETRSEPVEVPVTLRKQRAVVDRTIPSEHPIEE